MQYSYGTSFYLIVQYRVTARKERMGLPKDIGTWVFFIITLVAGYSLSVIANISTPRFQNWWAKRSRRSLEKRIKVLEAKLAKTEIIPGPTDIPALTLEMVRIVFFFLVGSVNLIVIGLCVVLGELAISVHQELWWGKFILGFGLGLFDGSILHVLKALRTHFPHLVDPEYPEILMAMIIILKNKLAQLEKH